MTTALPSTTQLQAFLYANIPACALLQVQVVAVSPTLILSLPHTLNHNHHHTIFGGSISLLATLAGWCQVHALCPSVQGNIVIASGTTDYLRPAKYDLFAQVMPLSSDEMLSVEQSLAKKNRAKIPLSVQLFSADNLKNACNSPNQVGKFAGKYMAIMP